MVLYDEPHPLGHEISQLQEHDMKRKPDCLIVMGTSLKIPGLKALIKAFACVMEQQAELDSARIKAKATKGASPKRKANNEKTKFQVIFVNKDPPSAEWHDIIDVHVQGETDLWVNGVEEEWRKSVPGDWLVQTVLQPVALGKASTVASKDKHINVVGPGHTNTNRSISGGLSDITNTMSQANGKHAHDPTTSESLGKPIPPLPSSFAPIRKLHSLGLRVSRVGKDKRGQSSSCDNALRPTLPISFSESPSERTILPMFCPGSESELSDLSDTEDENIESDRVAMKKRQRVI